MRTPILATTSVVVASLALGRPGEGWAQQIIFSPAGINPSSLNGLSQNGTLVVPAADAPFVVGNIVDGSLIIQNAGTVTVEAGAAGNIRNLTIGQGATGTVTVTGGSLLTLNGLLRVGGQSGTGFLNITNDGTVNVTSSGLSIGGSTIDGANGTGTVTVDGTGSALTYSGANAPQSFYVGNHGSGTLTIQNGGRVTSSVGLNIGGSTDATGTVTVTGAGSELMVPSIFDGVSGGKGTLTIQNDGTVTLPGGVSLMVGAFNGVGTLNIGAAPGDPLAAPGTLNAAAVSLSNTASTINFNHDATNYTFALPITGAGAVNVLAGTTILTAANSYTGGTTVSGGTLGLSGAGTLGSNSGKTTVTGGVLDLGGLNRTQNGGLTLTSGTVQDGTLVSSGIFDVQAGTISAVLDGTGALIKTTGGTVTLSGANTYGGGTTIDGGTINLTSTGSLSSAVTVNPFGTLSGTGTVNAPVTLNGTLVPGMPGVPGTITLGPLTLNSGSLLSYQLSTPGVVGAGINSLTDVNGALTINGADTVFATNTGTFGVGTYRLINYTTGQLFPNGAITVGILPDGATGVIDISTPGQVNLVVSAAPAATQFWDGANMTAGNVPNGRGGDGTWNNTSTNWTTSTGSFNSSWQGNAAVFAGAAGTVTVADTIAYKSMQFSTGGYLLTASAGGTLMPTGVAPINVDGGLTATIAAPITGSGGLATNDIGTLILTGDNTYMGGTAINFGTLQLGNGGTTGSIVGNVTNNGTLAFNRSDNVTFGGIISGSGELTQLGPGTLVLTGDSTYTGGTLISGGTLQIGNGGTTGSILGDVTDNGTLAFNRSDNFTFGGVISGTGAVQQIGPGTTVLTGANTYVGPTTIAAGTLQAGATNTLPMTTAVTVEAPGTLDLHNFNQSIGSLAGAGSVMLGTATLTTGNDNTSTDFSGIISGSGALDKVGAGIFTFSGTNTYTGGTTISGGTLQVGNGGTTGSILGDVANDGTLAFNRSDNVTFGGIISGSGELTQLGPGTLVLTGDSTYTGGTTISAGTLQLGNGGTTGSIVGDVTDNSILAFDRSDVVTFPGVISGTGAVQQIGTGTLVLSADNSYTGPTDVVSGILDVTGSIASSSLTTVASGATLIGTGTVGNTQINSGGTFAPGNGTPGTFITVAGNLAFESGALYMVQVNPATASFTTVSGTASLNGTVDAAFAPGSYVSKQYLILQSAGLGGTMFSGLTTVGLPAGFIASLSYSPDDAFLNLTAALGAGTMLNVNQQNVATALNNFFNSRHALPPNFVNLFNLSGANLASSLTQLSGEDATGAERSSFQLTNEFLNLMLNPYVATSGVAPAQPVSPQPPAVYKAPVYKAPVLTFEQRWTVWAAGFGGSGTANGNPVIGSNNVTTSTFGYAAGMDYHYSPDTVLGFALAGGGTNWGLAQGLGSGRSDAFLAGIHGITHQGPWYVAGALAFANNWFTTERTALGEPLNASFQGQDYAGRLEGGYRFAVPFASDTIGITPYAAIQTQDFHSPSYSETDVTAGGFGLTYDAKNGTDTRSELGGRFDDQTALSAMPLVLRAKVAWAHDWVSTPALNASFESLPGTSFTVTGAPIPHDSALASASGQLFFTPNWSFLAKFDGEFASGAQIYAGSGTLRYSW